MAKKNASKVGRPKLADKDLKIDSFIFILIAVVLLLCLLIGGGFSFFG